MLVAMYAIEMERNWYAIYVRSKHEFVAYHELLKRGVESYLPQICISRQWKDRRKVVSFPLFPGYLFVRIDPNPIEVSKVLKVRGVVSVICSKKGYPASIPEDEINSLKLLVDSGKELDIYPHLTEGTRVLVTRGPLAGAKGRVAKKDLHYMLVVSVELLGRSLGVIIHADDVALA